MNYIYHIACTCVIICGGYMITKWEPIRYNVIVFLLVGEDYRFWILCSDLIRTG